MIDVGDCRINVSVEGKSDGPYLMLSNSLGTNMEMWKPQMATLLNKYRVIRYDRRGHGKSDLGSSKYSIELFGNDILSILDALNVQKTHWCGLSMGGMVGQWLGANAPARFDKLILANTSSYYPDPTNWDNRIKALREGGFKSIADAAITVWFTPRFRELDPHSVAYMREMLIATHIEGYVGCCEALRQLDQRKLLPRIVAPTLVIAGKHDNATPVAAGEFIHSQIKNSEILILDAAHISNIEQSVEFSEAVNNFLS